ncbi:hypothetical protein [Agromyces badenianii]|uniref:hypothetical protein n=1 Tax=Agromyces badenianii TaxID=2080742 RepID=UPI000D5975E9|nr:hypothetical protein [Agromyces badenianii]PWC05007.1 hypothetical protein DCE94_01430 [Agromyces badenianii]
MRLLRIVLTTVAAAVAAIGMQIVALISLDAASFGYFSIIYLVGAFALSVSLSAVSEAWVRSELAGTLSDWRSYASVTIYFSGIAALVASAVALLIPPLAPSWWLAALAVFGTVYRASARFHSMRSGQWGGVIAGDVVGMLAVVGALILILTYARGSLEAVMSAWALASMSSALCSRIAVPMPPTVIGTWVRRNRHAISPLLRDSLVMDTAAIGTPYVLAPILGVANFGIYRAVSNVAAPVRLLLNPIRPKLSTLPLSKLVNRSTLIGLLGLSLAVGGIASGALLLLNALDLDLGALNDLTPFALPTGLFVAGNMLGHSYYLIARQHATAERIVRARLVQTLLAVVLPISGAIFAGLPGAIWAYTIATCSSAAFWAVSAHRS